jgi:hypothetical protein
LVYADNQQVTEHKTYQAPKTSLKKELNIFLIETIIWVNIQIIRPFYLSGKLKSMKNEHIAIALNTTDEMLMRILQLVSGDEDNTIPEEETEPEPEETIEIDIEELGEEEEQLFREADENIETVRDYRKHFYFAYK